MWIMTETIVSISQMNTNLNNVIDITQKYGSAIVMKNNVPVYITFEPNHFNTNKMPKIAMREASRNLSKLIYLLYDSGYAVVTKRNKPAFVIYDFNIIQNSNIGLIQMVKKEMIKEEKNAETPV